MQKRGAVRRAVHGLVRGGRWSVCAGHRLHGRDAGAAAYSGGGEEFFVCIGNVEIDVTATGPI